jgi:hypothetical protein
MLDTWGDIDGTHDLSFAAANGNRTSELIGASTLNYTREGEKVLTRGTSGLSSVQLTYSTLGEVTSVNGPMGSPVEVSSIGYGPRGDVAVLTSAANGVWHYFTDDARNRWGAAPFGRPRRHDRISSLRWSLPRLYFAGRSTTGAALPV